MEIVKLHTIDSTNDFLKREAKAGRITKDTLVWSKEQTKGHGQRGAAWTSEKGKNLTFSFFRRAHRLSVHNQFYITMAASLAVKEVLEKLLITNVMVKWPNDILADKQKICGILIESVIKKNTLEAVIIGIGLNVNQTEFKTLSRATSIKNQTGIHFHLEEVLSLLIDAFHTYVRHITKGDFKLISSSYEQVLFRRDMPSTFERENGERFVGMIKGIDSAGRLLLLEEDQVINTYDLKEIALLY